MWDYDPSDEFGRRSKRYTKKHPRELASVSTNLSRVLKSLQEGANPQKLPFGFIHIEQRGVVAIDQSGGGKGLAATRLYVYLDRDTETIHLITLGDKNTQKDDLLYAAEYVESLFKQKDGDKTNG